MTQHLTQQELESYLWGAAKLLRGLVDAGDYKQYIFPLLFFKRLSDVWDEEFETALAETKDKKYARSTADDRFAIPDGAHWADVRGASRDVGRALLTAPNRHATRSSSRRPVSTMIVRGRCHALCACAALWPSLQSSPCRSCSSLCVTDHAQHNRIVGACVV